MTVGIYTASQRISVYAALTSKSLSSLSWIALCVKSNLCLRTTLDLGNLFCSLSNVLYIGS